MGKMIEKSDKLKKVFGVRPKSPNSDEERSTSPTNTELETISRFFFFILFILFFSFCFIVLFTSFTIGNNIKVSSCSWIFVLLLFCF
jgi:hypothetical protein